MLLKLLQIKEEIQMLVKITIPVLDSYEHNIFYQERYFDCNRKSPSKEDVLSYLRNEYEIWKDEPMFNRESAIAEIKIVESVKEWHYVSMTGFNYISTHIDHPKGGSSTFKWEVIIPIKIG